MLFSCRAKGPQAHESCKAAPADIAGLLKARVQFEKNEMDLIKHHPELEDVWGDLEAKVEIVEPVKAPQPTAVSRKLLPFQLEGLHWMQTQEAGLWKGGMRASVSWSLRSRLSRLQWPMRWAWARLS
jgi:hypothetical protein